MNYCSDCKHKYTMSQSSCTECRLFDKMEKGNPAVALLEKIITEIEDKRRKDCPETNQTDCEWGMTMAYERSVIIIDEYIEKLKGSD